MCGFMCNMETTVVAIGQSPVVSDPVGDPMDCSTPGLPVPHHFPEFAQIHVHCVGDIIQSSYPLTPSSPSALNISQHQGLFRVICLHQMTKILELQLSLWKT